MLRTLAALARRFAAREGLSVLEWRVHAARCANPNPRLRAALQRRGFAVEDAEGVGACYVLRSRLNVRAAPPRPGRES